MLRELKTDHGIDNLPDPAHIIKRLWVNLVAMSDNAPMIIFDGEKVSCAPLKIAQFNSEEVCMYY